MKPLLVGIAAVSLALSAAAVFAPMVNPFSDALIARLTPSRAQAKSSGQLRFLTANLWHDFPFHRDLEARWSVLAAAMERESVDIACLQEVPQTAALSNRAEWLGQKLGAAYVYGRANASGGAIGFEEGVAIVSRYPLREPRLVELQPQSSIMAHRVALRAIAVTPLGEIAVYCAHLTTNSAVNARQIAWLRDFALVDAGGRAALIAGDFNAGEGSAGIQAVQQAWADTFRIANPGDPGLTFSIDLPALGSVFKTRYDYIFHQPGAVALAVTGSRLIFAPPDRISDHMGALTTFSPLSNMACEPEIGGASRPC